MRRTPRPCGLRRDEPAPSRLAAPRPDRGPGADRRLTLAAVVSRCLIGGLYLTAVAIVGQPQTAVTGSTSPNLSISQGGCPRANLAMSTREIRLLQWKRAAQSQASQLPQPPQSARRRADQRRGNQIAPPIRMKQVELGAPARLVEKTVSAAGLLGARHFVDAVIEQRNVDPLSGFQQLLQSDDLLRAVVPELTVIRH